MKRWLLVLVGVWVCASLVACARAPMVTPVAGERVALRPQPTAKSLILFIGDGMGPEILSMAAVYSNKALGSTLNIATLSATGRMGLVTTYSANRLVTDSAAGATALATGTKTNNGMVGVSPEGQTLLNLLEMASARGKAVGVITTTAVTDATPAAFLAHIQARARETDIALQIVEGNATVVMGGGKAFFRAADGGKRTDGRDLTEEARRWDFDLAFDKEGMAAAQGARLLGLFADEDLPFEGSRVAYETPSLAEMFRKALGMLTGDPEGFVLVVEGGRIDHAEHENNLPDAVGDLLQFDAAVREAMRYQESDSTLTIVVTADHDTGGPVLTSTEAGYPPVSAAADMLTRDFAFVRWVSEGHTGVMVPVVARGPGQEMFTGMQDNTDINHAIVRTLGLAENPER